MVSEMMLFIVTHSDTISGPPDRPTFDKWELVFFKVMLQWFLDLPAQPHSASNINLSKHPVCFEGLKLIMTQK